jgi:hypothetical protein
MSVAGSHFQIRRQVVGKTDMNTAVTRLDTPVGLHAGPGPSFQLDRTVFGTELHIIEAPGYVNASIAGVRFKRSIEIFGLNAAVAGVGAKRAMKTA